MGCRGRETLQNLCDQIPGDALLYSMFKVDAEPIKCPIRGMSFTHAERKKRRKNPFHHPKHSLPKWSMTKF